MVGFSNTGKTSKLEKLAQDVLIFMTGIISASGLIYTGFFKNKDI